MTPLICGINQGHLEMVKTLVQDPYRADVNLAMVGDESPLQVAAYEGHLDICQFLIDNQADVNQVTVKGNFDGNGPKFDF